MTQKDYVAIAETILSLPGSFDTAEVSRIATHFAHCLNAAYGNFDSDRFLSYVRERAEDSFCDRACLRSDCNA